RVRRGSMIRLLDRKIRAIVFDVEAHENGGYLLTVKVTEGVRSRKHVAPGTRADWTDSDVRDFRYRRQRSQTFVRREQPVLVYGELPAARPRMLAEGSLVDMVKRLRRANATTDDPRAQAVLTKVLGEILQEGEPLVVVPSPPGAGKTSLVEALAAAAVHTGMRVLVAAPRAEQTYDFVRRLLVDYQSMPIQALLALGRELPNDLRLAGVPNPRRARDLVPGPGVVVSTVDKLVDCAPDFGPNAFQLLIVDEAWQVTYGDLLAPLTVAGQILVVGDAGQLRPLIRSDTHRFEVRSHRVHWPAPEEFMRRHPHAPVVPLPATRRLLQDTVDFVQPAFYPQLPFVSAVAPADRQLRAATAGSGSGVDRAIDSLLEGTTLVGLLLPSRSHAGVEYDSEVSRLAARVAQRLLERRVQWVGKRTIAAADIGCVDPHRNSGTAIRRALSEAGIGHELMVSTPEIWQGLQRPIIVARYPIRPGRRQTIFDLEPGRVCVQLSRHQLGCIIVGRDGVRETLANHQHDVSARAPEAVDSEFLGWRAHSELWSRLDSAKRLIRL
ncbi:MAG: AAA family ATPase, partial [Solirubrobacterales bacterium]